jgi:predicted RNA-binding Zn-ribbon protein involved in translation (DUF1610 family)
MKPEPPSNDNEQLATAGRVWMFWTCPACGSDNDEENCQRLSAVYTCQGCNREVHVMVEQR